jgi:two-component system LytT family response regulator
MIAPAPRGQPPYSVLLVDDERIALAGLRAMLARHQELSVIGEARDGDEAVQAIRRLQPDVVFLDIQMPARGGFGVLDAIGFVPRKPAVVFVTAYSEFALDAYNADAVDYLHKPFEDVRLSQAVRRVLRHLRGARAEPGARAEGTRRLLLRGLHESTFVDVADIRRVSVHGNYLQIHSATGEQLVRETLGAFTRDLHESGATGFLRVSRSALINLSHVRAVRATASGRYEFELESGETVLSSRRYRRDVRAAMEAL